jgi:hypothetical protein
MTCVAGSLIVKLTSCISVSADAPQAILLDQLACRVTLASWFSIYFSIFHQLTKFWTICKTALSYIVVQFSQNHPFYLWFSCYGDGSANLRNFTRMGHLQTMKERVERVNVLVTILSLV